MADTAHHGLKNKERKCTAAVHASSVVLRLVNSSPVKRPRSAESMATAVDGPRNSATTSDVRTPRWSVIRLMRDLNRGTNTEIAAAASAPPSRKRSAASKTYTSRYTKRNQKSSR